MASILFCANLVAANEEVDSVDREPDAVRRRSRVAKNVAAPTETIAAIKVIGQRKIEEDAVRQKLSSRVGETFDRQKVRGDVLALFKSGYFYDIEVQKEGKGQVTLTYRLTEKPAISSVEFEGNSELDDNELGDTTGLKAFEILDMSRVRDAVEKIEKAYEDKGYFLARVKFRTVPDEKGETARLIFDVQENEMVRVKKITFLGNRRLSSNRLMSAMITKEGGFFSFISGAGAYKQDAFDRDTQILNYLYFNEGFVQVKIDRPHVYVTPDKRGIFITIRIEEGEQFNVGSVDFTGDLLFPEEELFRAISIKESELFSYETLQKDIQALQAKYGDLGYAYANPIPRTRVREKDRLVDITFEIDRGNKVYIGKINVIGNTKTRDKVVRRELQIREGELFNETRRRESLANVKRLGFFDEVNFNTSVPTENPDTMNIDIVVKERNTGTIQVGAGYSTFAGLVLNGQVNQMNLFGRGQRFGLSVNVNQRESLFNLNFTEPYFRDTLWEVGLDLYQRQRVLLEYAERKTGGAVRVGHPLAPYLRGIISYKLDETKLDLGSDGDEELFPVETANGLTSSMTFSLIYDKRNDRMFPTDGMFGSMSVEYAGLGGELEYTKGLANFRYYKNLFWNVVWRNNINYGFVVPNEAGGTVPFNELFLLGGANSLRGFDWFSVGRRKYSAKACSERLSVSQCSPGTPEGMLPFGGTQQFYYQMEWQFPLITEAGIQGVLFYDVGNADDTIVFSELRSNVGFGFRWFSPIGPLRFEWGLPLDRQEEYFERNVNFNFSIGAPF